MTGREATTIHRLLEWNPRLLRFEMNELHRLACDAVVVDEASMLDVELAASLFKALPPHARVKTALAARARSALAPWQQRS